MKTCRDLSIMGDADVPITLAIGVFDGVHRGHQALIERALGEAAAHGGEAWVLTFDPHPLRILSPEEAPSLLTSTRHKLRLLESLGIAGCTLLPFTKEVAQWPAGAFVEFLAREIPSLQEVVVGTNWRFGHRGSGDCSLLEKMASQLGFSAYAMGPVMWDGEPVSSTRIRAAVASGLLEDAERMLGRPFSVLGRVIKGRQVGRELGFPTANLNPENEVRPPPGIYAARARMGSTCYGGAAYIAGPGAPTRETAEVEVHLFDVEPDLYDRDLEVSFLRKIRDDKRFESKDELKAQIGRDVKEARRILDSRNEK
jgi:riboflavin kinase/FMN adenylyltransferase